MSYAYRNKQNPKEIKKKPYEFGAIYVIGLGTGQVKVGKSVEPVRRIQGHRSTLGSVTSFTKVWYSKSHWGYSQNEQSLIRYLNAPGGREIGYADVDDVISYAKELMIETNNKIPIETRRLIEEMFM